ncbi:MULTISPECIES: alpha/beta hydrolase [unclassified Cupriavidus]|uniref:alpha/beta hydrolase n=1 Tax=Cupriavidus sp. H19C3 TaxID=3241603 RepID=UPI003BF86BF8
MTVALLPAIEFETAPDPTHAVIWMHGLGADGSDFAPVVPELGLAGAPPIRFIFPHAPALPVTANGGYVMPAWYDILSFDEVGRRADEAGIRASRQAIRALIARENARGVPSANIVLAGFSQGGAIAYTAGLTHPERLAGIVALSTYIPSTELVARDASTANAGLPILAAHGSEDEVVPLGLGERARDFVQGRGHPVEWHTYPMPHSVCLEEIAAIGAWLRARFA